MAEDRVPSPDDLPYQARRRDREAEQELKELESRHERDERARNWVAWGKLTLFGIVAALTGLALLIFAWHFLTPPCMHWLSEEILAEIRTFIFSVGVAGGAASYLRSYSGE